MKAKIFFLLCVIAATISGCVKAPSYPIEPHIEFKSVSSDIVNSGFTDSIIISFTDGDGDIGVVPSSDDSCNVCGLAQGDSSCLRLSGFNVYLIDSRGDSCVTVLASANIKTTGKFKALSGEIIAIKSINSLKCFAVPQPGCPDDTVRYSILIRDLAGHLSNIVQTTPIVVRGDY